MLGVGRGRFLAGADHDVVELRQSGGRIFLSRSHSVRHSYFDLPQKSHRPQRQWLSALEKKGVETTLRTAA
jgi:hypothetical protein